MFSIAAINDTESKDQWEPLAPTKEAQEFHLSQTYHDGLLKLQAKEYARACEHLEAVLRDPLIKNAQVDKSASDGHLLQLRFLALKNLATVFVQQGSMHFDSALRCYLQAVEIDTKDSVVWNQLGTLSCSMGSLSISRWAFEQGLICSPNNWNCMEKLLEVLIAIGDEVACLSVVELILRHWPSHSRALYVKNTIEELESVPFAPRGIDKLEPKHARLKFPNKRKATDGNIDEGIQLKRQNQNIDLHPTEASWAALADALLGILSPVSVCGSEQEFGQNQGDRLNDKHDYTHDKIPMISTDVQRSSIGLPALEHGKYNEKVYRCRDIRLSIHLPSGAKNSIVSQDRKGVDDGPAGEDMNLDDDNNEKVSMIKEKEASIYDEHPQERRSTRLERLRSRKPGKEELDFATSKKLAKVVIQFLEPFIVGGFGTKDSEDATSCSVPCSDALAYPLDTEHNDIVSFVKETSNNYGAYHMGHLLLEEVARRCLPYRDSFIKLLELEKLTRQWGQDRTPECSLFLAELYYDIGSAMDSNQYEFISEASFHLCKVIELVAMDYHLRFRGEIISDDSRITVNPVDLSKSTALDCLSGKKNSSSLNISSDTGILSADNPVCQELLMDNSILSNKSSMWIRFFWLSGRLSILDGDKAKAYQEFCIALSLLSTKKDMNDPLRVTSLPHCKLIKEVTVERVLHEINLLKVDILLKKTVGDMFENEMYSECVGLLAPLLLSTKDVYLDSLLGACKNGEVVTSLELLALDFLITACEKAKPMDIEIYLNCHRRKLQVLSVVAGMVECSSSCKSFYKKTPTKEQPAPDLEPVESKWKPWSQLVVEEIKAISQSATRVKNIITQPGNAGCISIAESIIGDIQSLLLTVMCNIVSILLSKKSSAAGTADTEQLESCCFVDAAIAFCKLQHLSQTVPVKTQVELIVAVHDLLAEYGLCCAGKDIEGKEGTFLKLAIKHLFALDMKLKLSCHSSNMGPELAECDVRKPNYSDLKTSQLKRNSLATETGWTEKDETSLREDDVLEGSHSESICPHEGLEKGDGGLEFETHEHDGKSNLLDAEKISNQCIRSGNQITEAENDKVELGIDNALDQSFFCLYGLNLRSDSSCEDDLAVHKNTNRGDYQTKDQCADVFQYILPYAKASSKTGLIKLRRVLRAIRKHFPQPPEDLLSGNSIDKFLDDPNLCEDKISEEAGSDGFLESILNIIFPNERGLNQCKAITIESSEPYLDVYSSLYYFLAQSEEMSATDKWPGFVLTKEGEEFVEQNANLFKYDLLYNPLRFESWQRLANIYDEEVDLLLNDGSKHINVKGWRKNLNLPQRVETSRRRSRRCLLMSLALAKTSIQQGEIHELLALVYYDGLQNVVPFYDQRSVIPSKDAAWMMFCQNSMKHFEKAFAHKQDWSHAFYMGKLCEKLGHSREKSFSYYDKAITLNPSAVDPVYRMHASRLKLLCTCGKKNLEALQAVAAYSFSQSKKDAVMNIFGWTSFDILQFPKDDKDGNIQANYEKTMESVHLEEPWNILYNDCLSALKTCVEGDLKHFHKARYMLAQALYNRGESGDLERAKDELSFCFKSSRSSFTINMWEIDGMVKKGRRKTPGLAGNKKALEVNLPESSRKFITCIRKYILFYLKLLQETGDICTLERAYSSLRADKRFSLCLEDLVPVALGRYILALIASIRQAENQSSGAVSSSVDHRLEKMFNLFVEQGNLWTEIGNLPELKHPELSESILYGYLHLYIDSLEKNVKLETLEGINEKIRKRLKNLKWSNSNCAKVCRHVSVAWCRSIVVSLALITPVNTEISGGTQMPNQVGGNSEKSWMLCVDLQANELWSSLSEDLILPKGLETNHSELSKIRHIIIKQASEENMETANNLLRCSYNFYRDSSCGTLPSGINLYMLPSHLATGTQMLPGIDGVDILDLSIPRKLLLWAYALVHGCYANILAVVKHCEENAKSKIKKAAGMSSIPSHTGTSSSILVHSGGGRDKMGHDGSGEAEDNPSIAVSSVSLPEGDIPTGSNALACLTEAQKISITSPQLRQCNNITTEHSITDMHGGDDGRG